MVETVARRDHSCLSAAAISTTSSNFDSNLDDCNYEEEEKRSDRKRHGALNQVQRRRAVNRKEAQARHETSLEGSTLLTNIKFQGEMIFVLLRSSAWQSGVCSP
jgi:hypothetical protein